MVNTVRSIYIRGEPFNIGGGEGLTCKNIQGNSHPKPTLMKVRASASDGYHEDVDEKRTHRL